jgi:FkbM family methyltransferase
MNAVTDTAEPRSGAGAYVLASVTDTAQRIWTHPENRGIRLRRLAGWVGWQTWERVVRRPWTIPFHGGLRMVCHPHDTVTSLVLYCGLYDVEEMRFLLAWLRPGDTFLDVGANVAPYSLLSTLVPDVRAVAFEPGSLARSRARANIELNGVGDRVELVPFAVAESEGRVRLTADRWATNVLVDGDYDGAVEQVESVSLDRFDADTRLGRVGLVKIDVEGHELGVLRGAAALLTRERPALLVELNDVSALRGFAESSGYTAVRFSPDTGALAPRPWPTTSGGNILLVGDVDAASRRLASRAG